MSAAFSFGESRLTSSILASLAKEPLAEVKISDKAKTRANKFRAVVDEAIKSGKTFYGINTGFGFLANVTIPPNDLKELQENIVRSHACGVGQAVSPEISRAVLLLRAHTFLLGHCGVSFEVISTLKQMLEKDILPMIPEQGSVGACGDLAPLAHVALCMMGEGTVWCKGKWVETKDAFAKAGIEPLRLKPKEGLALINGTQYMTAIAALAVEEAKNLMFAANLVGALSLDAVRGTKVAFDKRIHAIRLQKGQNDIAEKLNLIFSGQDEIMTSHKDCTKVQDPYSFRCMPQVHGPSLDAIRYVGNVIDNELNSVTDNPLVFENGDVLSGGNFHGQPVSMSMDFLGIAVAELGSIAEQRIQRMINPQTSGLPAFLMEKSGLNSGFMIPHVVAASLVSENKIYAHPACVDSIPTSADKEDHVSMGPIAARKARSINTNVSKVLAIEALAAAQGVDLLKPLRVTNPILKKAYDAIRERSPYVSKDRVLHGDIAKLSDWILSGEMRQLFAKEKIECAY